MGNQRSAQAAGRPRDGCGRAHLHVAARRRETRLVHRNHKVHRPVSRRSCPAGSFRFAGDGRSAVTPPASPLFSPRGSAQEIEEGETFAPKFDAGGLIACVVTDSQTGAVLMVAHMNTQALERTILTGEAWFYSRSREKLWK